MMTDIQMTAQTSDRGYALVTGGTQGLGLELVTELMHQGFDVVATCRDPADPQTIELFNYLRDSYPDRKLSAEALDMNSNNSIKNFAARIIGSGHSFSAVYYNAAIADRGVKRGFLLNDYGPEMAALTEEQLRETLRAEQLQVLNGKVSHSVMQADFHGPDLLTQLLHPGYDPSQIAHKDGMAITYVLSSVIKEEFEAFPHIAWVNQRLYCQNYMRAKVLLCDHVLRPLAMAAEYNALSYPDKAALSVSGASPGGKTGAEHNAAMRTRMTNFIEQAEHPKHSAIGMVAYTISELALLRNGQSDRNGCITGWNPERPEFLRPDDQDLSYRRTAAASP